MSESGNFFQMLYLVLKGVVVVAASVVVLVTSVVVLQKHGCYSTLL